MLNACDGIPGHQEPAGAIWSLPSYTPQTKLYRHPKRPKNNINTRNRRVLRLWSRGDLLERPAFGWEERGSSTTNSSNMAISIVLIITVPIIIVIGIIVRVVIISIRTRKRIRPRITAAKVIVICIVTIMIILEER